MNQFSAKITGIEGVENIHFITLDAGDEKLTMLTLELPQNAAVGRVVDVVVKPSNVVIAKNLSGSVSVSNILPATITHIDLGKLVAMVESRFCDIVLQSLLSVKSVQKLDLKEGESVQLLIQASALSIIEVKDV